MKKIYLVLAAVILFSLSGCSYPEAKVSRFEWLGYNNEEKSIGTNLYIDVLNNNIFDIPISGISYRFSIFDKDVVNNLSPLSKNIASQQTTHLMLPLTFDLKNTLDIGLQLVRNKKWPWQLAGALKVNTPVGVFDLPFEKQGSWTRPDSMDGIGDAVGKGLDWLSDVLGKKTKNGE